MGGIRTVKRLSNKLLVYLLRFPWYRRKFVCQIRFEKSYKSNHTTLKLHQPGWFVSWTFFNKRHGTLTLFRFDQCQYRHKKMWMKETISQAQTVDKEHCGCISAKRRSWNENKLLITQSGLTALWTFKRENEDIWVSHWNILVEFWI